MAIERLETETGSALVVSDWLSSKASLPPPAETTTTRDDGRASAGSSVCPRYRYNRAPSALMRKLWSDAVRGSPRESFPSRDSSGEFQLLVGSRYTRSCCWSGAEAVLSASALTTAGLTCAAFLRLGGNASPETIGLDVQAPIVQRRDANRGCSGDWMQVQLAHHFSSTKLWPPVTSSRLPVEAVNDQHSGTLGCAVLGKCLQKHEIGHLAGQAALKRYALIDDNKSVTSLSH